MKTSNLAMTSGAERRQHERIFVEASIELELQSIAGGIRYIFQTINVSKGGFLIKGDPKRHYPFNGSSILNLWLFPEGNRENAIYMMTCQVRRTSENDIGLKIVQIDQDNKNKLYAFIEGYINK